MGRGVSDWSEGSLTLGGVQTSHKSGVSFKHGEGVRTKE